MKAKPLPSGKKRAATAAKPSRPPVRASKRRAVASPEKWILRLYVAGKTPKSVAALTNLKRICEDHLAGRYRIEVIDLAKTPQLAKSDQIVALLTLVRQLPAPIKRIIGDLSNLERVLIGMELKPAAEDSIADLSQS